MTTIRDLQVDIDLRYRNTFSIRQKLVWMNEEQRELFDILEIDSLPYAFKTTENEKMYPLPDEFDVTKIKVVTLQVNDSGTFVEVPALRNDDNQYTSEADLWYLIVANVLLLNIPGGAKKDRTVYVYCDADPDIIIESDLDKTSILPTKYHEILKLGVLERIAAARKDIVMKNNYSVEKQEKIDNLIWQKKLQEPEWITVIDSMPYRAGSVGYRRWC